MLRGASTRADPDRSSCNLTIDTRPNLAGLFTSVPAGQVRHPNFGDVKYEVEDLPWDPDGQVERTIALMRRYAVEDAQTDAVKDEVRRALQGMAVQDLGEREVAERVWRYVKSKMNFANDNVVSGPVEDQITGGNGDYITEVLIRPQDMARMPRGLGDCDDYSMLAASMLTACGIPSSFVTVAADPRIPDAYTHVYLCAYVRDGENSSWRRTRVPIDASHGGYCGWEVENRLGKRREWKVTDGGSGWLGLGGLGAVGDCVCITAPCNCEGSADTVVPPAPSTSDPVVLPRTSSNPSLFEIYMLPAGLLATVIPHDAVPAETIRSAAPVVSGAIWLGLAYLFFKD